MTPAHLCVRLPRTSRRFRRFDARTRRWLANTAAPTREAFVTSSVYGVEGGRAAILRAMRAADRRPRRSRPLLEAHVVAMFNDAGHAARSIVRDPASVAAQPGERVCSARPQVLARVRRDLPPEVRREARWWCLSLAVERLGVAAVRLVILRARAGGGDAIHRALRREIALAAPMFSGAV